MKKASLLLILACCVACSRSAGADYTPFEKYDSLVTSAVEGKNLPSCYRYLPLLLTDGDTLFVGSYASGLWALSVPVAHHYGLSVTDSEDERFDVARATQAAVAYLSELRKYFGGNDTLALRKYASTEPSLRVSPDSILWALRKIEAEYAKGLRTSSFLTPLSQTREELERLRMLRQEEQKRRAAALAARKAKAAPRVTYYKVRRGDVLGRIAQRNHCTVKQLKAWNNLKSDNIREGQRLKIYSR